MSDVQSSQSIGKDSLGILQLLSESVSVYLKGIWLFIPVSAALLVGLTLLNYAVFGNLLTASPEEMFASPWAIAGFISSILVGIVASAFMVGFLALAAYDIRLGRSIRMGTYVAVAIRSAPMLFVLSLIMGIAISIGMLLLVVPGVILMLMWSVVAPVVVIERAGFGSLSRSSGLTKGFRWPILGFYVLAFLAMMIVGAILGGVAGFGFSALFQTPTGFGFLMMQTLINSITTAYFSVAQVSLFARLKELKEGVGMSDLAEIFG